MIDDWLLSLIYAAWLALSTMPLGFNFGLACSSCCQPCGYPQPDAVVVDLANVASEQLYAAVNETVQNNFGTYHYTATTLWKELDVEGTYELAEDTGWLFGGKRYFYDDSAISLDVRIDDPSSTSRTVVLAVQVKPFTRTKYIQGLDNIVSEADMEDETWKDDCVQSFHTFIGPFQADPNSYPACVERQWGAAFFTQECSASNPNLYLHRFQVNFEPFAEWTAENGSLLNTPFNVAWEQHPPAGFPWRLKQTVEWRNQSSFVSYGGLNGRTVTVIEGAEEVRNIDNGFDITGIRLVYGDSQVEFPFL